LSDGVLDVCIFPQVNWWRLLRSAPGLLLRGTLNGRGVEHLQAATFELTSDAPAAFELDGEWAGHLPVTFSVEREKLRVAVP
jgi:diacylglycerol kinase family enzyme